MTMGNSVAAVCNVCVRTWLPASVAQISFCNTDTYTAHKYNFFVFLAFFFFFFWGDISILELYFFGLLIYLACHIFWAVAQLILAFATFFSECHLFA